MRDSYWPTLSLRLFCGVFGWHTAPHTQSFDGASLGGMCSRCGVHVLQDSQGNWFAAAEKEVGT